MTKKKGKNFLFCHPAHFLGTHYAKFYFRVSVYFKGTNSPLTPFKKRKHIKKKECRKKDKKQKRSCWCCCNGEPFFDIEEDYKYINKIKYLKEKVINDNK